jgi:hypothetical protein
MLAPAIWRNGKPIFGGKPALDRVMAGNVGDLFVVRRPVGECMAVLRPKVLA